MMLKALPSIPKLEGDSETSSVNSLARGTKSYKVEKTPDSVTGEDQLADPYGAVYPDNKFTQTRSGHVIEIDDTDKKEEESPMIGM